MNAEKEKDIIQEHFDLVDKRNEILKSPINSLTQIAIESLGKSDFEKKIDKHYEGFTLSQFLNHTAKKQ